MRPIFHYVFAVLGAAIVFTSARAQKQNLQSIIAEGAELRQLATGFTFTEGPAVDKEGNIYFTDQPNNKILKWSVDEKLSTFSDEAGRSNGLYFDRNGDLLACADLSNEIWIFKMDGTHQVLVDNYFGKRFNGPNDLWLDKKGGIYFTDPFYKRPYWKRGPKEMKEHVYYLDENRTTSVRVADDLQQPNGLVGTPDNKYLYVADIRAKQTYRYKIKKDGWLSDKKVFAPMGSDGMTIDNKGNVYLTGKGVTVFNKKGEQIAHIGIPENWTANITFGGRNRDILFITSMTSLYAIQTKVKGVY